MSTDNIDCQTFGLEPGSLPCDANPIQAISMGIATGGIALLFSYFLLKKVSRIRDVSLTTTVLVLKPVRHLPRIVVNRDIFVTNECILKWSENRTELNVSLPTFIFTPIQF